MSWKLIKLGEAATFVNGYAFKPSDWNGNGLPIVRIQDLTGNAYETNFYGGSIPNKYKVSDGDILISWSASLGVYEWHRGDAWLNQHIFKVVFDKLEWEKSFFKHLVSYKVAEMEKHVHGATMKHITKGRFDNIEIPHPSISCQQKIAAILDQADALRKKDQQLLAKYDELLESIFYDMFGDPVKNEKGWSTKKLGELMTIVRGGSPRPIEKFLGGTYPWIKISDGSKSNSIYLNKTKECITEQGLSKTRLLPAGSLIFANCGVSLGFARIITFEGCIHDGWLAMTDMNEKVIDKIFVLKVLNFITEYFRKTAPDGTQPNLNTGIMKDFNLILPSLSLQKKFVEIILNLEKQKQQAEQQLQQSENLFQSLLQKAFKGELIK